MPRRPTSCGAKRKRQAGPCCAPSSRARRSIRVTSRRRARTTAELSALCERHTAIEVLREWNRALERLAASTDELCETVVRLEAEVEAARAEREVRYVSPFLYFPVSGVGLTVHSGLETRCQRHPPRFPSQRLEHAHLLEEHGVVDGRVTADALRQAARTVALAEREVGFLKALNVRSPLLSGVIFVSRKLIHPPRTDELRERRSCVGPRLHGPG